MSKVCSKVFLFLFHVFLRFYFTATDHNNMEGEICTTNGDQCKQLKNCSYFNYEDIKKGLFRPPVCGFLGSEPIVCCTKNFNKMFGFGRKTKSAEMCEKYEHQICSNYNRTSKDYNPAEVRNLPFLALIGYGSSNNITWKCTGSIVSIRYVLTAAQCSNDIAFGSSKWVIVGDIEDSTKSQKFQIVSRFVHPEHKNQSLYDDIAIYRLSKDIQFNEFARPICLHQYISILTHRTVLVAGSEYSSSGITKYPNIVEVQLNLLPISSCNISSHRDKLSGGPSKRGMICAGEIQDGEDKCPDDYGGPVYLPPSRGQLQDGCFLYTQVGLTISPFECGKRLHPGIYTNLGNYIHWVESIIWPGEISNDSSTTVWV